MPVQGAFYKWMWGVGHDSGGSGSVQINFPPKDALALVSLSHASGSGLCAAGIAQYRTRGNAGGPDQDHNFAWDPNLGFPPLARDTNMTSVSASLSLGAHP